GDNNGNNDSSFNNCGINGGNAVFGDVEIDGGGIGNSGNASITSSVISLNSLSSTITNGTGDGNLNGNNSTGADGQGDGNGVDGNVEVIGGGLLNASGAALTLNSTTITGNSIKSKPAIGAGAVSGDGQVINGTVTLNGPNQLSL